MKPPHNAPPIDPSGPPAWTGLAARLPLGLVLVFSGLLKTSAPAEEFAVVIENFRILPESMVVTMAAVVPWLEIILGLALILGYLTRLAASAAGTMLILFIGALASTQIRGFQLPNCGCFGQGVHLTTLQAVGLDAFLVLLAFLAYKKGSAKLSLDNWVNSGHNQA